MFADRLKRLRKEHGYTQESLAAVIGVERSSVGKYE
ncbi:MAG TPA: helix-turn-helix transcriptional regulator, partial [Candidatus Alectryocaccomicrobium excrementavium]|nr:helix-turn-helix transcriptional regulator [Candidatus Alectryocaccomicrobium excrementavium]